MLKYRSLQSAYLRRWLGGVVVELARPDAVADKADREDAVRVEHEERLLRLDALQSTCMADKDTDSA